MTKLRDALEKAAKTTEPGESPRAPDFSVAPHIVPDVWQFDTSVAVSAADPSPYRDPGAPQTRTTPVSPPVSAGQPALAAATLEDTDRGDGNPVDGTNLQQTTLEQTTAQPDGWSSYPFDKRAAGKLVVGSPIYPGLIEQYRRLGAVLHHHQLQTGARTVMVTSAAASEGKTLTATNLALTLSHSYQRRVLLFDADLRRPNIHEMLSLPNSVGLGDYLRSAEAYTPEFHNVSPTLSVLTAGRADSDPMAGLVSDRMRGLLADAAREFEWVIVDTPPVALMPDANLLAEMVDSALMVVRANATPYPLVRRAIDAIGEQRILGVVLNRMAGADLAYYGYGGYGYGYRYGYGQHKPAGRGLRFWLRRAPVAAPTPSGPGTMAMPGGPGAL